MELISSDERNQLFESFAHDAFHSELRDDYSVPNEDGPYRAVRGGAGPPTRRGAAGAEGPR
ncbi:DUF6879 family protein [uncultured Streptomyces sp.]|uniref:DUF6879 family protein n=1 Tax=uncultured Streptomyces sp. TaxID=174707 RepID=UPI00344609C1